MPVSSLKAIICSNQLRYLSLFGTKKTYKGYQWVTLRGMVLIYGPGAPFEYWSLTYHTVTIKLSFEYAPDRRLYTTANPADVEPRKNWPGHIGLSSESASAADMIIWIFPAVAPRLLSVCRQNWSASLSRIVDRSRHLTIKSKVWRTTWLASHFLRLLITTGQSSIKCVYSQSILTI